MSVPVAHSRLVYTLLSGMLTRVSHFPFLRVVELANRVALFIDGAYLDYVLRAEFKGARIDYRALSEQLADDSDILRTYCYH